ncbi:hypothetical protein PSP6_270247 [Paraburkholderia tropica]|nr:hypothetical protein PSP6_270247 [Paraburkholderia tropica]
MALPMSIGILLFSGFPFRDVARIVETCGPTSRPGNGAWEEPTDVQRNIHFLSLSGGRVVSSSGVHVWTERIDLDSSASGFQMMVVASGNSCDRAWEDARLCAWLRQQSLQSGVVASIWIANRFFPAAAA